MLTYLRYALAAVCFAASVGCLALWWRSKTTWDMAMRGASVRQPTTLCFESSDGYATAAFVSGLSQAPVSEWFHLSHELNVFHQTEIESRLNRYGNFGVLDQQDLAGYCPLWYPALIFALAGIGVLRLGRRFTLRSAIIATTVVAALLGMAVVL
jgi:hypothetical protein